ncbi:MAG: DUF695 domain-containing protein [Neisseria sp.]|nr:DUF695 domain-containing protein [Neisseria sp.]
MQQATEPTPEQWQQAAADFWAAWQGEEDALSALDGEAFVNRGNEILNEYMDGVVLELIGDPQSGSLVFSANGIIEHFPKVQIVTDLACSERYPCVAFRQRMTDFASNFAIGMRDFSLSAQQIAMACEVGRGLVDLRLAFTEEIAPSFVEHAQNMSFIMLDHLLGEWDFAVKIGVVEFVDRAENMLPLDRLPEVLDRMWREDLGHDGLFPEPEWQYASYEWEEDEEQDALFMTRNESATRLLGRADMAWCVTAECEIPDKETLEQALEWEDAWCAHIEPLQIGIAALSVLNSSRGVRNVHMYGHDVAAMVKAAQQTLANFPDLNVDISAEYDPTWAWYRI